MDLAVYYSSQHDLASGEAMLTPRCIVYRWYLMFAWRAFSCVIPMLARENVLVLNANDPLC